jgi:hypothetical protein
MFEFTLSKVNMLIFVTAIAVVVIFFMNTLNDNLKTRQSYETAFKIGKEVKSLMDSDSYCSVKFIDIPRVISTKQGTLSTGITYKLGLQEYDLLNSKSIIIYITDSREREILGAYNLDYNGEINFYESEFNSPDYSFSELSDTNAIYEPRKVNSNETKLMFIKNIKDGITKYYVFPCEKRFSLYTCREYVCNDFTDRNDITCLEDFCRPMIP